MAQQPAAAEAGAEAPKSKKKLIVILAVVLALAGGGGAAAFFLMKKPEPPHKAKAATSHEEGAEDADAEEGHGDEAEEEEAEEEEAGGGGGHGEGGGGPAYLQFETFTVNLLPDPDEKFLQLDLTIEAKDAALVEKLKAQMPLMRNRVLMLLTSKKASDIATPEGKTQLSEELLAELKKPLKKGGKSLKVKQVLFTSFVIQ